MKQLFTSLVLFLSFFTNISFSQQPIFRNGDRICFIGSSIAQKGGNFHYINLFYATRYPEMKLTFLNGGIGGDITNGIIDRMEEDILSQKPTWVVMMLEENDLQPGLYYQSRQGEEGIAEKRHQWLNNWMKNADSIIRILKKTNVKIILETPTIYDQTAKLPAENGFGVNDSLQKCAEHLKQLAKKYDLPLVDCWTILKQVNEVVQKKDSTKSIIGEDRVHVSPMGYFVMAYQFLKSIPVNPVVSNVVIDIPANKLLQQDNCNITGLEATATRVSFTQAGKSLPFPSPEGVTVDSFFSFTTELNTELLRLKGLKPGKYNLKIDQNNIGSYSAKELQKGINLSLEKNTPQYLQAAAVLSLFVEYWELESSLRAIKFMDYNYVNEFKNKETKEDVQKSFDELLEKYKQSKSYNYLKNRFSTYMSQKPKEKEMLEKSESILQSIRQNCIPKEHRYIFEKIAG